jgi:hypothetical protein
MMDGQAITCEIRYRLDLDKLSEFESYARTWMRLIEQYGGVHHGYFVPRGAPAGVRFSFAGMGHDGPADVAIALFTFPDVESYTRYRETVANDPECLAAAALVSETQCFASYERLFLRPVERDA